MQGGGAIRDGVARPEALRPEHAGAPLPPRTSIRALAPAPAQARPIQLQIALDPAILHARIPDFAVVVALRQRPELRDAALIVGDAGQGRGTVWAASPAARAQGVVAGMALRQAEALCPRAVVLLVDRVGLRRAADDVLAVLGAYTPLVEPSWGVVPPDVSASGRSPARRTRIAAGTGIAPRFGDPELPGMLGDRSHAPADGACGAPGPSPRRRDSALPSGERALRALACCFGAWLDVRGCERLFGPAGQVAHTAGAELVARGYPVQLGVAATPSLAAVASALATPSAPRLVPVGEDRAFLDALPLERFGPLLEIDAALLAHLRSLGIRQIGELARLPAASLRRRFGEAGSVAHEEATGGRVRAVRQQGSPRVLGRERLLEDAVADSQRLGYELGVLAERLAADLAVAGEAGGRIALDVTDERGASYARSLRLKEPVATAAAIRARGEELLAQLAPAVPLCALRLELSLLGPATWQLSLPLGAVPVGEAAPIDVVAMGLRRRFGARAARKARLVADPLLPEEGVVWDTPDDRPPRPRPALAVRSAEDGCPLAVRRGAGQWEPVRQVCSQWRLRTRWWMDTTHRHYYLVETARGAILELYRELADDRWHLASRRD